VATSPNVTLKGGRSMEKGNTERNEIETNMIHLGGTVDHEPNGDASNGAPNQEVRVQVPLRNPSCPYVILGEEKVEDKARDRDVPGSSLILQGYSYGRTGNRFSIVSNTLRLGFCCKSKIVSVATEPQKINCSSAYLQPKQASEEVLPISPVEFRHVDVARSSVTRKSILALLRICNFCSGCPPCG